MSDDKNDNEDLELPAAPGDLPELDFATFVMSIIGSAFVHLGDAPDPDSGKEEGPNLLMARQDIELLVLLQEKTKGNLTGEEERVLSQGLYDLRMRYIEVAKG
ncbi:MAG: DUF1844 domain-containing protein [Myxococcales bacterium]|nr:DUF1844 domain-containing protein [Myxococcales bacterium]